MLGKYNQNQLVVAKESTSNGSILKGIIYVICGEEIFNDEVVYAVKPWLLEDKTIRHAIDIFEPYGEQPINENDKVHSPSHYCVGGIETIDYIRAKLSKEAFVGYCMGNVMKYTSRYDHKGGVEDLNKAKVYLEWAIEEMRK